MIGQIVLDEQSTTPLYRQVHDSIRANIMDGTLAYGERLPPTRELAASLGLNRTTISAAYERLETAGLISGHVGRGSFVAWQGIPQGHTADDTISFAASRPSELLFPLEEFRETCREVIAGPEALAILQLGPSTGYGPLRRYLLEDARRKGNATDSDEIAVTSGCQQALDLIQRTLVSPGDVIVLEDPVYPGLRNVFRAAGARLIGAPMTSTGIDAASLARVMRQERPRLIVLTPNFQNPTGVTLQLENRREVLRLARENGTLIVENDTYGDLRYEGEPLPTLKHLDPGGDVILLGSFSKIAFPGLRVGWMIAPQTMIRKVSEAKQWCDLHTDQLSQAVLLRFAESGRLAAHRERMLEAGRERLRAAIAACERNLPPGSEFTRPEGGMNLWIRLPEGVDGAEMLARAQRAGVQYVAGRNFGVARDHANALRISFAGLAPDRIERGMAILGKIFVEELERVRTAQRQEPEPALV
jgi:2-aminoadipate transaminase